MIAGDSQFNSRSQRADRISSNEAWIPSRSSFSSGYSGFSFSSCSNRSIRMMESATTPAGPDSSRPPTTAGRLAEVHARRTRPASRRHPPWVGRRQPARRPRLTTSRYPRRLLRPERWAPPRPRQREAELARCNHSAPRPRLPRPATQTGEFDIGAGELPEALSCPPPAPPEPSDRGTGKSIPRRVIQQTNSWAIPRSGHFHLILGTNGRQTLRFTTVPQRFGPESPHGILVNPRSHTDGPPLTISHSQGQWQIVPRRGRRAGATQGVAQLDRRAVNAPRSRSWPRKLTPTAFSV
jgi:hypothetical protein